MMIEKDVSYRLFCDGCSMEFMPTVRWSDDIEIRFQALSTGWHVMKYEARCPRCDRRYDEHAKAKVA